MNDEVNGDASDHRLVSDSSEAPTRAVAAAGAQTEGRRTRASSLAGLPLCGFQLHLASELRFQVHQCKLDELGASIESSSAALGHQRQTNKTNRSPEEDLNDPSSSGGPNSRQVFRSASCLPFASAPEAPEAGPRSRRNNSKTAAAAAPETAGTLAPSSQVCAHSGPCSCPVCAASHWPARLRIVGSVTTRRHCRKAEELKVIRSGCISAASGATGARPASQSVAREQARSMSLTGGLGCPLALLPAPRLLVNEAPPLELPTRCKANSISTCVTLASYLSQRQHLLQLAQSKCLACELVADRGQRPRPAKLEPKNLLTPGEWASQSPSPVKGRRRHSWICR